MPNQPQQKPDAAPDKLRQLPLWARRYALSRSLGLLVALAVFASGFMNGGSGWSWGREPPLWAFLLCLPRVLLTPFRWVMLDTLWYPLPL